MREKFMQKDFQKINKELTIVKSVKDFKQLRQALYNKGQVA